MPRKRIRTGENYFKVFPTQLRNIVEEKGYTQETIGQALGKTRQAVAAYMSGTSSPDWETLAELSKLLNVSVDWLLGLREETPLDKKMNTACEVTGLSEIAIEKLQSFTGGGIYKERVSILEHLFTDLLFWGMVKSFEEYSDALSMDFLLDEMKVDASDPAAEDFINMRTQNLINHKGILRQLKIQKHLEKIDDPEFQDEIEGSKSYVASDVARHFLIESFYLWLDRLGTPSTNYAEIVKKKAADK